MKLAPFSSLLLLGATVSAASNAAVYESARPQRDAPVVSVKNAVLYLADKFNIGDYYSLTDDAVDFIDLVHQESDKPKLLVVVRGVDQPETFAEQPSFYVDLAKHNSAQHLVKDLTKKMPRQVADNVGGKTTKLTDEFKVVSAAQEPVQDFKYFTDKLPQMWDQLFERKHESVGQQLAALKDSGLRLVNDKLYISELMQLIQFAASEAGQTDLVVANLDSLFSIGSKIGYSSHTYQVAKGALSHSIQALQNTHDVTVVAIGPDHKLDKSHMNKRAKVLDQAWAEFGKRGAVAAKSCFADKDACVANTNDCNSHGKCTKIGASCWQCACSATTDKKTSKTTKWAGYDCSKKDIAAQAHLLLWTTVAMLVAAVGGVKLLYSIGDESLPGVLQAATIDTSR